MTDRQATQTLTCSNCPNTIQIDQHWTAGGMNDYGGYVLQCTRCNHVFSFRLGRDINDSHVSKGAKVLETWDESVPGDKEAALQRQGLTD